MQHNLYERWNLVWLPRWLNGKPTFDQRHDKPLIQIGSILTPKANEQKALYKTDVIETQTMAIEVAPRIVTEIQSLA